MVLENTILSGSQAEGRPDVWTCPTSDFIYGGALFSAGSEQKTGGDLVWWEEHRAWESWLLHLVAVRPCGSHGILISLGFLIQKMGIHSTHACGT